MKEIIKTENAPAPIGPYNQAIKVNDTLYISGQIPLIPSTMELLKGTIQEETELVMESILTMKVHLLEKQLQLKHYQNQFVLKFQ